MTWSKKELAIKVIEEGGGLVGSMELAAAGISPYEAAALCKEGYITRIKRGFYCLPQGKDPSDEQILQELFPQGIVCVESALFHYGYSDFLPRAWSVAVPRTSVRAVRNFALLPLKAYYVAKEFWELGRTVEAFNGVELPVYDRERTICDCFKYRTRLDHETFNKAVKAYVADEEKDLAKLSLYGKEMHLYGKLMNLMEVLLNG